MTERQGEVPKIIISDKFSKNARAAIAAQLANKETAIGLAQRAGEDIPVTDIRFKIGSERHRQTDEIFVDPKHTNGRRGSGRYAGYGVY